MDKNGLFQLAVGSGKGLKDGPPVPRAAFLFPLQARKRSFSDLNRICIMYGLFSFLFSYGRLGILLMAPNLSGAQIVYARFMRKKVVF